MPVGFDEGTLVRLLTVQEARELVPAPADEATAPSTTVEKHERAKPAGRVTTGRPEVQFHRLTEIQVFHRDEVARHRGSLSPAISSVAAPR